MPKVLYGEALGFMFGGRVQESGVLGLFTNVKKRTRRGGIIQGREIIGGCRLLE